MSPSTFTSGPRGRRVLLELAIMLDGDLRDAISARAFALDLERGADVWAFGWENGEPVSGPEYEKRRAGAAPTTAQIAQRLTALHLPEAGPDPDALLTALRRSVDDARYWQEPSGIDVFGGQRELRAPLRRLAAWAAPAVPEYWDAPASPEQYAITWRGADFTPTGDIEGWKAQVLADEERARAERPTDVTENISGAWWSTPDGVTTTAAINAVPTGLYWSEDAPGGPATTAPVDGSGARILEIGSTSDWNTLCWDQPLEVTASRRHDWYRVSGVDGRWVIPDWAVVAKKYDAARLSVGAYLAGANHALTVDRGIHTMIAGWGLGETRWLTPPAIGPGTVWEFDDEGRPRTEGHNPPCRVRLEG